MIHSSSVTLSVAFLILSIIVTTTQFVVDDFSDLSPGNSNFYECRRLVDGDFVMKPKSLSIKKDGGRVQLIEPLSKSRVHANVEHLALVINYSTEHPRIMIIDFIANNRWFGNDIATRAYRTAVHLSPKDKQVSISMSQFLGADLTRGRSFVIWAYSSMTIHAIEMVNDSVPAISTIKYDLELKRLDLIEILTRIDAEEKDRDSHLFREPPRPFPTCDIKVSRNNIFNDAFHQILESSPSYLRRYLKISFEGEDYDGGVPSTRDFFSLLSKEFFKPSNGIFQNIEHDIPMIAVKPVTESSSSFLYPEDSPYHIRVARFFGRLVGMAIFHDHKLTVPFSLSIFKAILNKEVNFADLKEIDPKVYRWLLEVLTADDVDKFKLTMTYSYCDNNNNNNDASNEEQAEQQIQQCQASELVTHELVPEGLKTKVTKDNVDEYIIKYCQYRYNDLIKDQVQAFQKGIFEIVPEELLLPFNELELKYLITNNVTLDIGDWEKSTNYEYYNCGSPVVQWFWHCMTMWKIHKPSKFFQFLAALTARPYTGFEDSPRNQFTIARYNGLENPDDHLPRAVKNCDTLLLPPYSSYGVLDQKLKEAPRLMNI